MTTAQQESVPSMAQSAYLAVREGIIHGIYKPGSRLRERELSDELRMSRVPIREALRQLEAEGFVATFPNRGAVVIQLTLKDVTELFDIRLSLEVLAARQAAQAVAEGRAGDTLREVVAEAYRATLAEDADAIRQANTQFHAETIAMTGNSLLIATMAPLLGRIRWLFALTADRVMATMYVDGPSPCGSCQG